MLKKQPSKYILVYALINHPVLGCIPEPYAVQLNDDGHPTLNHNRLFNHTLKSYIPDADETDVKLVKLMQDYSAEGIGKKFNKDKKLRNTEYFQKADKEEAKKFIPYVEGKVQKILELMVGKKPLHFKGNNDNPLSRKINLVEEPASILFHFRKEEDGMRYYPTIKNNGELVRFSKKNCLVVTNEPCWFLVENDLYHFDQAVEGKKLVPFFTKSYIAISRDNEENYFKKFVLPLSEKYPVETHGYPVKTFTPDPEPVISLAPALDGKWSFMLAYYYNDIKVYAHHKKDQFASLSENSNPEAGFYEIEKICRSFKKEENVMNFLTSLGLELQNDNTLKISGQSNGNGHEFHDYLMFINEYHDTLVEKGIKILQDPASNDYFLGTPVLDIEIQDKHDWFDIYAVVNFGEHKVPFRKLKNHILSGIREYTLPDGKIAILPEEWFSRYKDIFSFAKQEGKKENLRIKKHHYRLLADLPGNEKVMRSTFLKKLERLHNSNSKKTVSTPENVSATMRPYQLQGLTWLNNLKETGLGGCLADDMGLGKTLQTLSLISKIREDCIKSNESYPPSLIVMPASLVHNWYNEVGKFTPDLKVLMYTGTDRKENLNMILRVDVVLTTYGTVRNDIDLFRDYIFNYVILDESQNIKNPGSKIARTVRKLNANNKLVLTGTPIENSLTDLWSQMHFVNPGLLGGFEFFRREYVVPIEKKKDTETQEKLKKLIAPFILRRTKGQVAKELPSLTEKTHYCEMTTSQQKEYDKLKSYFRNQILNKIEKSGLKKSQFQILRALTQLRLMANHPDLLTFTQSKTSGKFDEVIAMIESVLEEDHKILVYSQFVKHLNIFKAHFDKAGISYAYLTGSTSKREEEIDSFINDDNKNVFLISLKAGGSGLNLMAADYVFMLDPWWNPAVEQQAINRAHRIGQDKKVFSYKFITKDTIEEKIVNLQQRKSALSQNIIQPTKGGADIMNLEDIKDIFG